VYTLHIYEKRILTAYNYFELTIEDIFLNIVHKVDKIGLTQPIETVQLSDNIPEKRAAI